MTTSILLNRTRKGSGEMHIKTAYFIFLHFARWNYHSNYLKQTTNIYAITLYILQSM
jgi:hypothetical protein